MRNDRYDGILTRINGALEGVDDEIASQSGVLKSGPVFIVGLHRSGTSLLNQLMINRFGFAFPSNLVARFWKAPVLGMALWKSLTADANQRVPLESRFGLTTGVDEPHEFGWFWREYFPTATIAVPDELDDPKFGRLVGKLSALGELTGRTLLFKNLVQLSLNTRALKRLFPTAKFIRVIRNPFFVIQSTLVSRKGCYGDIQSWFGVIPPEHGEWETLPPEEQVVRQVRTVGRYLDEHLSTMPQEDALSVEYEELVSQPARVLAEIGTWLDASEELENDADYSGLRSGNRVTMDIAGIDRLFEACRACGMTNFEAENWLAFTRDELVGRGSQHA